MTATDPHTPAAPLAIHHVIYEVTAEIDADIVEDYRAWLRDHVAEILTLPGFVGAQPYQVLEPAPEDGRIGIGVHYQLRDLAALADYLRDHAPRLRADGIARFGNKMRTSRRVLARAT